MHSTILATTARKSYNPTMPVRKMTLIYEDATDVLAHVGNVVVTVHGSHLTLEGIARLDALIDAARACSPTGKAVCISMVQMSKVSVTPEIRAKLHEIMGQWKQKFIAAATILDGPGIVIAAIRAMMTAMGLVTKATYASKIFANADDALTWAMQQLGPEWSSADRTDCARQIKLLFHKHKAAA